jgi:glycosyltransferase involved in cell wall biosynthesis
VEVSVVIPAYNAARTIGETIRSVIAQTAPGWEVIIVDDGSIDATAEIADGFARQDERIRVVRQANVGEAGARNTGIEHARFDWLLFLDADDWISDNHLQLLSTELKARPDLDAVIGGSVRVTSDGTHVSDDYVAPEGDLFPTLARRAAFPIHACIVRRSLVELAGKFDTTLRTSPDWDLWQRIARMGAKFGIVRTVVAFYRMSASSASSDAELMFINGLRVLKQGHAPDPRVPTADPAYVNGLSGDVVDSQVFYLLSWCAGLLLGAGKDARGLLDLAREYHWPDLNPWAIAKCIFDAGIVTTRQPGRIWETLLPGAVQPVEDYLLALERQSAANSQTPNLAKRALFELKKMTLRYSVLWSEVIDGEEAELFRAQRRAAALELQKGWLQNSLDRQQLEIAAIQSDLDRSRRLIDTQTVELAESRRLIDTQTVELAESRRLINTQTVELAESERLKADLQKQLRELGSQKTVIESNLVSAREDADALELDRARLTDSLGEWEQFARSLESKFGALHKGNWGRFGLWSGLLKPMDVTPGAQPYPAGEYLCAPPPASAEANETRLNPRLQVNGDCAARLVLRPDRAEWFRVGIRRTDGVSWHIQLNFANLSLMRDCRYRLEFRARSDSPRTVTMGIAEDHAPWNNLGYFQEFQLGTCWQSFQIECVIAANDENARVHVDMGNDPAPVEISSLSLRILPEPLGSGT